jgi:hypothetical protein
MGTGAKIALLVTGIFAIGFLMLAAFYLGKQSKTTDDEIQISVTGEPTVEVLPTITTEPVATETAEISPTPTSKLFKPPLLKVSLILPSPTPKPTIALQVNPNLIKNLKLVPSNTPTPTLIKVKLPIQQHVIPNL